MPYKINWLIKNEIVYVHFWGAGNEDELREVLTTIAMMREESPRDAVHVITNTTGVTLPLRFQDSMNVIKEFKGFSNAGWEIVIGKLDKIMSFSLLISRSLLRSKSINLQNMDEAINYLKKEDDALNWSNIDKSLLETEGMSQ